MKRTISTMICIAAAALAFTACDDDTEYRLAEAPTVTLSPSSITLSAEAVGSYTINYTVSSPGEGASVSAAADVSWISGVDASVSGQVRLSVAANASDGMRTGTVTLTYSYDGGAVTARAAVVQYGAGDPVLTVDPNAVVASYDGGTYSFGYALENPLDGEGVSCSSDAGWVSGFDYSSYGTVSFTVEASEEEELRTATITVSYASLSKEVTVVQDHPGNGTGGGGDFDGTIDSLVGTYTAGGYAYYDSGVAAYTTWTLKIYKYDGSAKCSTPNYSGSFDYYIDGICPSAEGSYDYYGDHRVSAAAYVDAGGRLVVPTQVLNTTSSGYYVGWTPCTGYSSSGWSYNYGWPDLTFTYNGSNGCWEADYGVFMGAFTTTSLTPGTNSGFYSFFDVVSPGDFQFTKDGDLGGGGGDYPNYSDMTGTYSCEGYGRISGGYGDAKWDMYVTAKSDTEYYVYCLTPYAGGLDIANAGSSYWAVGHWGTETTFVVPSQVCRGQVNSTSGDTYYWGYTPCTEYDGSSWYYSSQWPDLTFTKTGDDTWESDYGVFAAGCTGYDISTFTSYFGVVAPSIKATKTSSTVPEPEPETAAASGRSLPAEACTNLKVSSAPASGTVSVTRSLGSLPLGSAKPAK